VRRDEDGEEELEEQDEKEQEQGEQEQEAAAATQREQQQQQQQQLAAGQAVLAEWDGAWLEAKIVRIIDEGKEGGVEYAVMEHGRRGVTWNVIREEIKIRTGSHSHRVV
jgi:hypothetical protein